MASHHPSASVDASTQPQPQSLHFFNNNNTSSYYANEVMSGGMHVASYDMEAETTSPRGGQRRRASPTSASGPHHGHGVVSSSTSGNRDDVSPVPQCSSSGYGCSNHQAYMGMWIILHHFCDGGNSRKNVLPQLLGMRPSGYHFEHNFLSSRYLEEFTRMSNFFFKSA